MKLTTPEIYKLSSEISEKEFENLFNRFTSEERSIFNRLIQLGDKREVALWTVISERYEVKSTEFHQSAFNF